MVQMRRNSGWPSPSLCEYLTCTIHPYLQPSPIRVPMKRLPGLPPELRFNCKKVDLDDLNIVSDQFAISNP